MIVPLNARVVKDGLPHLVENRQMGGCPRGAERGGVILFHELAERRNSHLEMWNEARIKLKEANKLGDIPNDNRGGPMVQELVLRLGRAITIGTDVNTDELKTLGEEF